MKKNKKILAITASLDLNKSIGKYWSNLLKEFDKEEIDVYAIRDIKDINRPTLTYNFMKKIKLTDYYLSYLLYKKIVKDLDKYDIIYSDMFTGWYFLRKLKNNPIRKISLVRNSFLNFYDGFKSVGGFNNFLKAIFSKYILGYVERVTCKYSNLVISVSEYSTQNLKKWKYDNNYMTISNAIEINLFKPLNNKKELRKELNLDKNKFYMIFVGRLTYDKGREVIIKVMNKLLTLNNNIELLVIDDSSFNGKLPKNIKYLGKMENKKLIKYHNAVDCMFFPTLYEGDSLAILEAASSGLPIIASNTGGLWELKKKNKILKNWIVPIGDSDVIIGKYIKLILTLYENKNKKLYKELVSEWSMWGRKKDIYDNMIRYSKIIKE